MSTPPMLRQLRHDVWATGKLIDHCRGLTDAQLELTVPGTYGSIRRTFVHTVSAAERYLRRFLPMPEPILDEDANPNASLDVIAEHLRHAAEGVEKLFAGADLDPDRVIRDARRRNPADPPLLITSWVLLNQFAHHGSDHRAQIGTILGANGLATPDIDVWAYGRENDAVKEETKSTISR
jgi:uncharacterized damage-inducible protein DinB